jgi:transcriptional regulator with XRE-family HTH domain
MEQDLVANNMWGLGHDWRRVTVSEIERGRRNVTVPELLSLTVVLDVTVEQLLDPRGPERRDGPRLLLAAALARLAPRQYGLAAVDAERVGDLVCGHHGRVHFDWGSGIRYTGPEGAS